MQAIFRLSNLLLIPLFLFAFENLYTLNPSNFEITTTKNTYKLTLKNQHYIDYNESKGFKFFIPYFTKEFSLKVLRYNSIGYINGLLSMDKSFSKVIKAQNEDLKYYLTDYSTDDQRELDYLLKGYTIPYLKQTSLSIEAYNIPLKVSTKLNKYLYFKKIPIKNNKLKYILYSFYIVLDKKAVDRYVKRNFKTNNCIQTFLKNVNNINIKKQTSKHEKKVHYRLVLKRILNMISYGHVYQKIDLDTLCKCKKQDLNILDTTKEKLENLKQKLQSSFDKPIIINPKSKLEPIIDEIDTLEFDMQNYDFDIKPEINKPKCFFTPQNINKKCFKNPAYFHNYVNYLIHNFNFNLDDDTILLYSDYKTFNDIGKYFYEIGDYARSELYLQKAYLLAKNKNIPAHNLAVFYFTRGEYYNPKKAVNFLQKSTLEIDYYNLALCYYMGSGIKESDKMARYYFKKAQKIPFAKKNYEIMKKFNIGK